MRFVLSLVLATATVAPQADVRSGAPQRAAAPWQHKVDPWVLETARTGRTEFLVFLSEQADVSDAARLATKAERGRFVFGRLRETAGRTQAPLLAFLADRRVEHQSYWVANMIWVRGTSEIVEELALRPDVAHLYANPEVRLSAPVDEARADEAPAAIEWGVGKIHAPEVWAQGFTGQGVVVGGQDTGYDWDHPALKGKYRGWSGVSADHNYNWHDAIHSGGGVCGANSPEPCDDQSHGTHTMGTMVGDDGAGNQVGVAPGAKWIGCRNMDQGNGTPATYSECFQWFIAPTNLANQNPDPSKAPDVINNSWGCPPSEGCTNPDVLKTVVENTRAAGIVVVVSAGNAGSACSTVSDPPAIYAASFSVGATDINDVIAGFSSRGPVTIDGSNRLKPNISAPGVNVRSSLPGGGYGVFSGTSMAGPHVAGAVALLQSAYPQLNGQVSAIETTLQSTAVPRTTTQTCGGIPGTAIPNNTYGYGRIDAFSAFVSRSADVRVQAVDSPDPVGMGRPLTYDVTITNLGPATATQVLLSNLLPASVTTDSITPSAGACTQAGRVVTCTLGALALNGTATVRMIVQPTATGTLTNTATVSAAERDTVAANNSAQTQTSVQACPTPVPPAITAPASVPPQGTGFTASAPPHAGHVFTWTLTGGGAIASGQGTNQITFSSGDAGATLSLSVVDTDALGCEAASAPKTVPVHFNDVPPAHPLYGFVNTLSRNGVTSGCGGGNYCPDTDVLRSQMAVFLLRSKLGSAYVPPPATGIFGDVPASDPFAPWIEDLFIRGVTGGCGGGNYCPSSPVLRSQMAVFLLRTKEGPSYAPPPATGIFGDVPASDPFAPWIEELSRRGITAGCGGGNFCPGAAVTRGQMAVFLVRTFGLL